MMTEIILGLLIATPIILIVSYFVAGFAFFMIDALNIEWNFITRHFVTDDRIDSSETYIKVFVFMALGQNYLTLTPSILQSSLMSLMIRA